MKQLYPDLWQTSLYSSGILNSHAYFSEHPDGNILFYNMGDAAELDHIEQLGGIKYQMLTHRDEAGASLVRIQQRFGSTLMFSVNEADAISKHAKADHYFENDDYKLGDIHVLQTPGHTRGSVCFFYQSPHGKNYLFTGDTFFQWDGSWRRLVLSKAGGSEVALAQSLLKIRDLKPDVVMSSGFVGKVGLVEPSSEEWSEAINAEVSRLNKVS